MITLYDYPTALPSKSLSPYVWKVRLALNIKGIQHRTEWIEYADLEKKFKELGIPPSEIKQDGTPFYSVPAIYDDSTNTRISDSPKIIEYLDRTYPNTPRIIAPGTSILNAAFDSGFLQAVLKLWPILAPNVVANLKEESSNKYRRVLEGAMGMSVEQLKENKELQGTLWAAAEEAFKGPASWFKTADGKMKAGPWIMGDEVSMADLTLASALAFVIVIAGEDSEEWKKINGWSEGLWSALWERTKPYFKVY
ncbi:hypothetical protein MD484_g7885, partial [Candolleomyces efflorescens]